jgi:DNA-binding transcriptional regulator GbsR (MarR family)
MGIAEINAETVATLTVAVAIVLAGGWITISSKLAKNRRDNAKAEADFWKDQRATIKAEIQPEIDAIKKACEMSQRAHEECEKDRNKTESELRDAKARIEVLERKVGARK